MLFVRSGPFFHQMVAAAFDYGEALVNFPHQKESRIRCNLRTGEINENGFAEIWSNRLFFCFTIPEHRLNLRLD
jgi:hypothetical protein